MAQNEKVKRGLTMGCGVLVIAAFLILGSTVFVLRRLNVDHKAVCDSQKELFQTHGTPRAFVPTHGGLPTDERIVLFLKTRGDMLQWRESTVLQLADFIQKKQKKDGGGPLDYFRLARTTGDLFSHLARYWDARNKALLANDMGLGEYIYIYSLAYYSYLGYDPADGVQQVALDFDGDSSVVQGEVNPDETDQDKAWAQIHYLLQPMLEAALREGRFDDFRWKEALNSEVVRLAESPRRYPWRDGAPHALADVFRAHRRALEEQYDRALNPMELMYEDYGSGE